MLSNPLRRSKSKSRNAEATVILPAEPTLATRGGDVPVVLPAEPSVSVRSGDVPVVSPGNPTSRARSAPVPAISLEQRLDQLLRQGGVLEALEVTLPAALGCLLADDVVAGHPWPHFTSCSTDGYAARSADVRPGNRLAIIGSVLTGSDTEAAVGPGKVLRVQKGAPLPAVADVVLPAQAVAVVENNQIQVRRQVHPGSGILPEGSYARRGTILVQKNSLIDERVVGVLAGIGRSRVSVVPQPRVVIVSVGNGLIADGAPPTPGKHFDSANVLLSSATRAAGALPFRVGPLGEDLQLLADTLDDQLVRADVVVVCGGVESQSGSVRDVLSRIGNVSYDEGSTGLGSFGTGTMGEQQTSVVSLPADPVAAFMLFKILVDPLIASMLGRASPQLITLTLAADLPQHIDRVQIVLATVDDRGRATPLPTTHPTLLDLHAADAMIQILPGNGVQARDSSVAALLLGSQAKAG